MDTGANVGTPAWARAIADVLNSWFVVESDIDLKVKIDEDNLLEVKSRTNNHWPFTYFLSKYYSCPAVTSLQSLRMVITDVEMNVNIA